MTKAEHPPEFLKLLNSVVKKRPRTVIQHILSHGQITSQELKDTYGYNHPPRAIRDVREEGIPIETVRIEGNDGRKIAAYRFGDPSEVRNTQLSGRTAFTSELKNTLLELHGNKCHISLLEIPERNLQIDHRIPFEIAGDQQLSKDPMDYMLLSASANRTKSWSCEHCPNWIEKQVSVCVGCYWAFPESYSHICTKEFRRVEIAWFDDDVLSYSKISQRAASLNMSIQDFMKKCTLESLGDS